MERLKATWQYAQSVVDKDLHSSMERLKVECVSMPKYSADIYIPVWRD